MADQAQATSTSPKSPPKTPSAAASPPGAASGERSLGEDLEPDTAQDEDNDSALDVATVGGGSTSLGSSILRYRIENGRTYHAYKAGAYILPNDETENERLDLQHACCLLTLDNKMYLCPAGQDKPLRRVLDAGCGTGIWAMDFADEHPETEVTGIDLSPIQPSFVPPNVTFYVDDLEAEWTYNNSFDFIYMRMLSASIQDWPKLFTQAYENLEPGGYIELLDPVYPMVSDDGSLSKDSALYRWSSLLNDAATKLGSSLDSALSYKKQLTDAGFVNVTESVHKWPMNQWPKLAKHKELGAWIHENIMQGLQALSLALFTRALDWTPAELEVFLVNVRNDLRNRNIHGYWRIVVVHGQKPT